MSRKLIWVALMAPTLGLCFGGDTLAADISMPTSENPASVKWTKMTIGTFGVDPSVMFAQCDKQAAFNESDRLTPAHCAELRDKYGKGDYTVVYVNDGIVHDLMGARVNGQSKVVQLTEKQLGRSDRALRFRLSGDVDGYWYTGDKGVSCNNFAVTFLPVSPPPLLALKPAVVKPDPVKSVEYVSPVFKEPALPICRVASRTSVAPARVQHTFVNGVHIPHLCGCGHGGTYLPEMRSTTVIPSTTTTEMKLVCEDAHQDETN